MPTTKALRPPRAILICVAASSLLPGWACAKRVPVAVAPVYFPAAPELPRIQFLTSFAGLRDVQQQSSFARLVAGENPDIKVNKPYGVDVSGGRVYVCDTNSTVAVFDFEKKTFAPMKGAVGPGQLRQPTNISIAPDGTRYVSDPVRGQVLAFDKKDEFLRAYGDPNSWHPVDAVWFAGRLYVVDTTHAVVKVLDAASGEEVGTIGDKGDPADRLARPTNIAVDTEGRIYVTDFGRFQVLRFDREGVFQLAYGKLGDNRGHFARPKGIAVDRAGRLYVVDAAFNNVQIFDPAGRLLMFFGENSLGPGGLQLPAKVTIDYDNLKHFRQFLQPGFQAEYLVFVTGQVGERRVNVFAFGKAQGRRYPEDDELKRLIEERRKRELERPH